MTMNCYDLVRQVRQNYPANHFLFLSFANCVVRVAMNHNEIHDRLGRYFKPFVTGKQAVDIDISVHEAPEPQFGVTYSQKAPDPGKLKIKEEYADIAGGRVVRKRLTRMVFLFNEQVHAAVGPCLENLNQIVNFINNRFIQWRLCRAGVLGHAAAVVLNGKGVALAGFSGAGKSTLALHLMSRGAAFVSNDRLIVVKTQAGTTMYGVAKMPRINPGTALHNPDLATVLPSSESERLSTLPSDQLWRLEQKYDVMIDDHFGTGRFFLQAPMNGLVILNWKRNGGPTRARQVDLSRRGDLLSAFVKPVGLFFYTDETRAASEPCTNTYLNELAGAPVLELYGGADFSAAADACADLLGRAALAGAPSGTDQNPC